MSPGLSGQPAHDIKPWQSWQHSTGGLGMDDCLSALVLCVHCVHLYSTLDQELTARGLHHVFSLDLSVIELSSNSHS